MVIGCDLCDSALTQLIRVVKLYISVLCYMYIPAVILHKETRTAQGG